MEAEATISGTVEILDALATTSPVLSRKEITQAARALERTAVAGTRAAKSDLRGMRSAARAILHAGPALGRGEDGAAAATMLSSLVLLAMVIAKWHAARGHQQQATAARDAAEHLRTAYARHAATPLAVLHARGQQLPEPVRDRQATIVRQALPAGHAERLLAEDGWDALAATLVEAEVAGHDPQALLAHATARRELATADSATAVLTWCVRCDAGLPAPAPVATAAERRTDAALSRITSSRSVAPVLPEPPRPAASPAPGVARPRH